MDAQSNTARRGTAQEATRRKIERWQKLITANKALTPATKLVGLSISLDLALSRPHSTPLEIAARLGFSKGTVLRALNKLKQAGWLDGNLSLQIGGRS